MMQREKLSTVKTTDFFFCAIIFCRKENVHCAVTKQGERPQVTVIPSLPSMK